jgi:DNA-directed RNA polymerase specialized sigma subunit
MQEKLIEIDYSMSAEEKFINKEKMIQIMTLLESEYKHPECNILIYYYTKFNFSEIAKMLKISRHDVSRICKEQRQLVLDTISFEI